MEKLSCKLRKFSGGWSLNGVYVISGSILCNHITMSKSFTQTIISLTEKKVQKNNICISYLVIVFIAYFWFPRKSFILVPILCVFSNYLLHYLIKCWENWVFIQRLPSWRHLHIQCLNIMNSFLLCVSFRNKTLFSYTMK